MPAGDEPPAAGDAVASPGLADLGFDIETGFCEGTDAQIGNKLHPCRKVAVEAPT